MFIAERAQLLVATEFLVAFNDDYYLISISLD